MKTIFVIILFLLSINHTYALCDTLTLEGEYAYELTGDLWSADDMIFRGPAFIPFIHNVVVYSKGVISAYSLDMFINADKENCFGLPFIQFDIDSMHNYNVDSIPKYYRVDYFLNKLKSRTYKAVWGGEEFLYKIVKVRMKVLNTGNREQWIRNWKGIMIETKVPTYTVCSIEYIHPELY